MIRSARRFVALTGIAVLTLALFAAPAFAQAEEAESTSNAFWFNGAVLRFGFLAIMLVVFFALTVGYLVKVVVPKYRGRPA